MSGNHNMYCSANELADGVPPALWANLKTEIHGIVDARTYWLEGFIPLYTQPADYLTDEEIVKLHEETSFFGVLDPVKFARAILRKAQQ